MIGLTFKQALQKGYVKPVRNKAYRDYVASLPCVVTGIEPAGDSHHIISTGFGGGTGTKASDLFIFPLTRKQHILLHEDIEAWEARHGSQWEHICMAIHQAVTDGVIDL